MVSAMYNTWQKETIQQRLTLSLTQKLFHNWERRGTGGPVRDRQGGRCGTSPLDTNFKKKKKKKQAHAHSAPLSPGAFGWVGLLRSQHPV